MSYTEAFGSSANTDASTKQTKIKYGDYMKGISIPEAGKKITKSIKKQSKATTPGWYLESKEVLANGNSSDVKISFTKESMLKSRDTSNPLSELRHSLSLTVYNAWFGHIANPITSTEYRLYSYLSGKNKSSFNIDKYTWFDLDGVKFPSYGSTMDYEASKAQLTRIANILKAHPNVSLKLGGFTSEIGKRKSNRKISLEMAEQLKAALESLGVEPTRLSTKGYGETNPRSLNDTEFGKMRNHRVAFRVIKK